MPAVVDLTGASRQRRIDRPHDQMCWTGADFVITAGASIGLDRTGRRDGTNFVLVAVGPDLYPAQCRRRRWGPPPTWRCAAPRHSISL